jgi:phage-related protein
VVYQNGPASNRVNQVYASDGYTKADFIKQNTLKDHRICHHF